MSAGTAAPFVPAHASLARLREAAQRCRGCDLYRDATQAVLGEGPADARIVLVGEQPGDAEDREGRPFVGPAGALLDRALARAGIAREKSYVTNAVKHFKWKPRGKRRLHEKPSPNEVRACRPWFEAEMDALAPEAVVALGATAAQSLFGRSARVTLLRGRIFASEWAPVSAVTIHPSAILRAPDSEGRSSAFEAFVRDLVAVRRALESGRPAARKRAASSPAQRRL